MSEKALALIDIGDKALMTFTPQEVGLAKEQLAPKLSVPEFKLFMRLCQVRKLDPFAKQLTPIAFGRDDKRRVSYITSRDAMRTIAKRTGNYDGTTDAELFVETKDGEEVLLPHKMYNPEKHTKIISATIGVRHKEQSEPAFRTAVFKSFCKTGAGSEVWTAHPDLMIIKCAEAQALRAAFPEDLADLYAAEEMEQVKRQAAIDVEFSEVPPETSQPATAKSKKKPATQNESPPPEEPREAAEPSDSSADAEQSPLFEEPVAKAISVAEHYYAGIKAVDDEQAVFDQIHFKVREYFNVNLSTDVPADRVDELKGYLNEGVRIALEKAGLIKKLKRKSS